MASPAPAAKRLGRSQALLRVWDSVVEKIEDAETIVICGHVNPDGDAIGSTLALGQSLRRRYPQKAISCLLPAEGARSARLSLLAGSDRHDPGIFLSAQS